MKDYGLKNSKQGVTVTVRNCWWRRSSERSRPDSVLLDVGQLRSGDVEWNCATLTPRQARAVAAALNRAADETESMRGRTK